LSAPSSHRSARSVPTDTKSPPTVTVVSGNACPDWSQIGNAQTIGIGDVDYHSLFHGFAGQCFVLRGRTASGQGAMSGTDGRVRR
jgi:hypothetical protein